MWVEFAVSSRLCAESSSPGFPIFLSSQKLTFLNSNLTRTVDKELLCGDTTAKYHIFYFMLFYD